jgi:ATP-dependent Clp protease ATP-binding subunit ClpB
MNKFDEIVTGALEIAQSLALKHKNSEIAPCHLFLGLLSNPASFSSRELSEYRPQVQADLDACATVSGSIPLDQLRANSKLSEWFTLSSSNAVQSGRQEISEADLLRYIVDIFPHYNIDPNKLHAVDEQDVPDFLVNLNELASEGKLDPVIGRDSEIRAVMEILGRRQKNNPVLVGEAGVGKTAIVEGLAEAIVKGTVPDILLDKTVMSLNMGSLMAGTKYRGEFEQKLQSMISYVKERAGQVILFIDELHLLVGAGKTEGGMDAANLLKPALARGELHCIGATTHDEYQKFILGDAALDRRFRPVPINEPSKEDTIEILLGVKEKLEIHHGIKISDDAILGAVNLSAQYISDKNFPDKAIDLLDEASAAMKISAEAMPTHLIELQSQIRGKKILEQVENNKEIAGEIKSLEEEFSREKSIWENEVLSIKRVSELKNKLDRYKFELEQAERNQNYEEASKLKYSIIPEVEKELESCTHDWILKSTDVAKVISRQTGIPLEKINQSRQEKILELESFLNGRVYGQAEALKEIADTLITSHAGLTDETRPLGSFLLKGPSGVGKTETAKALSQFLFEDEGKIIRLDMSEYSEKHSVAKLIGAPAGYVGYEDGGVLTEKVRKSPYSIILLDEIEKAHPEFADILLQILDDGRLTDSKGRTISFKNCIVMMTTNATDIESSFRPEVLGRIDSILEYKHLGKDILDSLIDKELRLLQSRLKSREVNVDLNTNIRGQLKERGFDQRYGARPLSAVFNKLVVRPLSKKLLSTSFNGSHFTVDYSDGEVIIYEN